MRTLEQSLWHTEPAISDSTKNTLADAERLMGSDWIEFLGRLGLSAAVISSIIWGIIEVSQKVQTP